MRFGDRYMEPIFQWILSSTERIEINCDSPLPTEIGELLLRNSSEFHISTEGDHSNVYFHFYNCVYSFQI